MERNGHIQNKYHILLNGSCDTENREVENVLTNQMSGCHPLFQIAPERYKQHFFGTPSPEEHAWYIWKLGMRWYFRKIYGIRTDEQTDARYFYFVIVFF
jgi:hypothetical protein